MNSVVEFQDNPQRAPAKGRPAIRARGCLDFLELAGDQLRISGWVLHPLLPIQSVKLYVNDIPFGENLLVPRNDLAETFPSIPHAGLSGFEMTEAWTEDLGNICRVTVIGAAQEGDVAIFETHYEVVPADFPTPPAHLMMRVSGTNDPVGFRHLGLNASLNILAQIKRYRDLNRVSTTLDWGCGCGRLQAHLVKLLPEVVLMGCDLDREAVEWNNTHIRECSFLTVEPYPPTPFLPDSFDVIFGSSVMTHLTREDQSRWIEEIHRILRPDGLFVCSVHGEFAASFFPGGRERVTELGIVDEGLDPALDGVAPAGYYRGTFQTELFTREHWSTRFRIVDYVEAGLCAFQDLVVMEPIPVTPEARDLEALDGSGAGDEQRVALVQ